DDADGGAVTEPGDDHGGGRGGDQDAGGSRGAGGAIDDHHATPGTGSNSSPGGPPTKTGSSSSHRPPGGPDDPFTSHASDDDRARPCGQGGSQGASVNLLPGNSFGIALDDTGFEAVEAKSAFAVPECTMVSVGASPAPAVVPGTASCVSNADCGTKRCFAST